jgi:hypothetical protein
VNPNFSNNVSALPDAPKVSNEMISPSRPTYLCHPKEVNASTATLARTLLGGSLSNQNMLKFDALIAIHQLK